MGKNISGCRTRKSQQCEKMQFLQRTERNRGQWEDEVGALVVKGLACMLRRMDLALMVTGILKDVKKKNNMIRIILPEDHFGCNAQFSQLLSSTKIMSLSFLCHL